MTLYKIFDACMKCFFMRFDWSPCPDYSEYIIYAGFLDQASHIISYGGILFTVAVYGIKSQFGWRSTFFLDDFFILTFAISPILPFYTIGQFLLKNNLPYYKNHAVFFLLLIWLFLVWLIAALVVKFNYQRSFFKNINEKHLPKIRSSILYIILFYALAIISFDIIYIKNFSYNNWLELLNLHFLNLFSDVVNLALAFYLTLYHHLLKPGGIPRRIFFSTLFVLQVQLFFSYAYLCTLPIVDSFFNFILGIILSRTISSFFSKDDFGDFLMGVEDKNFKVIESIEAIRMQHDEDEALKDFETVTISGNENDDEVSRIVPTKVSFFKLIIALFFFLNVENGKLVYKIDKVNYLDARHLNIKESMDIYVEHGFLKIETGQIIYVGKNNLKRCINLTDNWPLKIEYEKVYIHSPHEQSFIGLTGHKFFEINHGKIMHVEDNRIKEIIDIVDHGLLKIVKFDTGFKVVYMKTPNATRFIDLTEHGLLNYIVYGHRKHLGRFILFGLFYKSQKMTFKL
ncbi:9429_t:CDS:2 [Dentiscutata heterogama]|uniref:9429_t:CDS:1 n=1 Tax=Dentiscutata heterogama TaxID=1316150 RepID=A0ACA9JVT6_9GLOM|nr:9429_t:CDS:2 [Dentiscutata heterogama]